MNNFRDIVNQIGSLIGTYVMPLLVSLALVYFLYNIAHFILNLGNEKERETFKNYSLNGILALFVLLSVWGIIGIFSTTLFNKSPVIPQFPTDASGGTGVPQ